MFSAKYNDKIEEIFSNKNHLNKTFLNILCIILSLSPCLIPETHKTDKKIHIFLCSIYH